MSNVTDAFTFHTFHHLLPFQADLTRGRTLGKVSIGQAVISANYAEMRIDIDAEESVHHVRLDTMVISPFPL